MIDVSIIIINYNTFQLTCNCIQSVFDKSQGFEYEIILVDNASSECEALLFLNKFPTINLIQSKENVGFAKGNNLGLKQAKGNYILLLNSDTELINNAVGICLNYLKLRPKVGVVSSKLIFPDGRVQSCAQKFVSIKILLFEFLRLQKLLPKRISEETLLGAFFDYQREIEADWVWGAFFMFPAKILSQLPNQKLDDRFFMYVEDKLWCKQIKQLGYKIMYNPEAEVIHYMGASAGKKNELMEKNEKIFLELYYNKFEVRVIQILSKLLK